MGPQSYPSSRTPGWPPTLRSRRSAHSSGRHQIHSRGLPGRPHIRRYLGAVLWRLLPGDPLRSHCPQTRPGPRHAPADRSPLLLAPSRPHFDPSYNNYFFSHKPLDIVDIGTTTAPSFSRPLRPWLRNKLAGTPLADLSSTTGRAWAGYYTVLGSGVRDPLMFLELRSTPPPLGSDADSKSDCVYFDGEGHDGVWTFTVMGVCDARTR